jgi:hypothetical protein
MSWNNPDLLETASGAAVWARGVAEVGLDRVDPD